MDSFRSAGSSSCGTRVRLKDGGFAQCEKPGLLVEVSTPQGSIQGVMCSDHMKSQQQSGLEIRIVGDGYIPRGSPKMRELLAKGTCTICNRLFSEHSAREFDDHRAQISAPHTRLYPKGQWAKKGNRVHYKCDICSRLYRDHSEQEYIACMKQKAKGNKLRQEDFKYVTCEVCGRKFGDHSSLEYDGCIDTLIDRQFSVMPAK